MTSAGSSLEREEKRSTDVRSWTRSPFRADIQGLRAIAVIGVVVFHAAPLALPGGFVGVDVFFVISGFLITNHLIAHLGTKGRIAFADFYARRIRRILPAAFAVLAATAAVCIVVVPPALLAAAS